MAKHSPNGAEGANGTVKQHPREIFADGKRMEAAVRESLREVRVLHKRMGVPLVGSSNGKLVSIPPEEIQVDDDSVSTDQLSPGTGGVAREG